MLRVDRVAAAAALARDLEDKADEILAPLGAEVTITGVACIIQWINNTLTRQFVGSFGLALAFIGLAWAPATLLRRVVMALIPNISTLGCVGRAGTDRRTAQANDCDGVLHRAGHCSR